MKSLIALALCWPVWVGAATGTSGAETFYVRPAAECENNGDGLAYNCAASGGASGAFKSWSGVSWSTTTGVDDGDTLVACGEFVAADFDTGSYMIFVAGTVTGADEAGRITITGDCSSQRSNPVSWTDRAGNSVSGASLNGGATLNYGVGWATSNYITFRNFYLTGFETAAVFSTCSPTSDPQSPIYQNLWITDSNKGMSFAGLDYQVTSVNVQDADSDGIFICNGNGSAVSGTLTNVTATNVALTDDGGDSIQQESGGGALTAVGITGSSNSTTKACFLFGSASGAIKVTDAICRKTSVSDINGIVIDGSASGGWVRQMFSDANNAHVFLRDSVTAFGGTFEVSGVIGIGGDRGVYLAGTHASGDFDVFNNSFYNCSEGIYFFSDFDPSAADFYNNAVDCASGLVAAATGSGGSDITLDYNRYGPSVTSWNWYGTTDTTLAAFQSTSSNDANSTQGVMGWANSVPTRATDFKPLPGSALRGAGTYLGNYQDHGNRRFKFPPSIGAWEAAAGDAAESRTARGQ